MTPPRSGRSRRRFPAVEDQSEDDGIDLPLWLRVHYRVNHPELTPAPAGAVGDYPEALENLHEWMKTHQDLGREP